MIFDDRLYSTQIAIKDSAGHVMTYQQMFEEAEQWKSLLEPRTLIAVFCDNSLETLSFIFEMLFLQQPIMLLAGELDEAERNALIEAYAPSYIWKTSSDDDIEERAKVKSYSQYCLLQRKTVNYVVHKELALLLSTSGSTGNQKMVRISYSNLCENLKMSVKTLEMSASYKNILTLPVNYILGLSLCLWHWSAGGTVYVTDYNLMSREFADLCDTEGINSIGGVPFTFKLLKKAKFWNEKRVHQFQCVLMAGAKMDIKEQAELYGILGDKFSIMYGQVETTGLILIARGEKIATNPSIIGKPVSNVNIMLAEDNELVIEAAYASMGYAESFDDLKKGDENRGVIYTGDVVSMDSDGYIYLQGRKKRFVKILGKRIGLDELENLLKGTVETHEFVCTGDTDELNIYIVGKKQNNIEYICERVLCTKLHISFKMLHFIWLDEIPRNESGKIMYNQLDSCD